MGPRLIRLRYAGHCADCDVAVPLGGRGWWDGESKTVRCETCGQTDPTRPPNTVAAEMMVRPLSPGVAGGSARAEYERRRRSREADVLTRHPRIGKVLLAVGEEPQPTRAWALGATGEEHVGAHLDQLASASVLVLHDRRIPGSRVNVDHIVIASSGVWVIDSKRYVGRVEGRDRGGWLRHDVRLYVGGRDRTNLVLAMEKQIEAVQQALTPLAVPFCPALCFVDAHWGVFAKPFEIDGVAITWPKALIRTIHNSGTGVIDVSAIATRIATRLPAAS